MGRGRLDRRHDRFSDPAAHRVLFHSGKSPTLTTTDLGPFACLGWVGGVFIFYAVVNEMAFHRDPGIGDGWTCPLPNGYAIEMIDVTDRGFVYNPRTQTISGVVAASNDALADVCLLQLAGRYILGGAPCQSYEDPGPEGHGKVLSYFMLDTATGTHADFPHT